MARGKGRINQGAHIKRNTHGTSNEISFSVLDAVKNTADATDPLEKEDPFWAHADEEVSRRKKRRRQQRLLFRVLVGIGCGALAALVGVGVWWGLQANQEMQGELGRVIGTIEEADEVVLPFDELAVKAMTESLGTLDEQGFRDSYAALLPQVDEALQKLDQARTDTEKLQPHLKAPADLETSNQVLVTISARKNMLAAGRDALQATDEAVQAYVAVQDAWNTLLAADTAARDAASLASLEGEANMRASLEKTDEAIAGFTQARDEFSLAAGLCPDAALDPYVDYVSTRLEAQEAARASTNAYLASNVEAMVQQNNRYNTLDSQAAAAMRSLNQQPTTLVSINFGQRRAGLFETYMQDRQRAADADAFLNDYVSSLV